MRKNNNLARIAAAAALTALVAVSACTAPKKAGDPKPAHQKAAKQARAPQNPGCMLMQKTLADAPDGRERATAKILVPGAARGTDVRAALEKTLADVRRDDPALKFAVIWAYRTRGELNNDYTLGKIEWSSDGKDFNGQAPLTPNPRFDILLK